MDGLIGYTGFVGSNLHNQHCFDKVFNSRNIAEITDYEFDLLVCAGVSGVKWMANKNPEQDMKSIETLLSYLKNVRCKKLILISTIDVYPDPFKVDETIKPESGNNHSYGKHRLYAEEFVCRHFMDFSIMRLPALFGNGLRKNFIYDMLNDHCLEWTHRDSQFQYYYLDNIWRDLSVILKHDLPIVNISSEPVTAMEVSRTCFGKDFNNITERKPEKYDVRSIYARKFNSSGNYIYSKEQVFCELKEFIANYNHAKEVLK